MIIDTWLIIIGIAFILFIWFLILKYKANKQLKKLRRDYNEEENKSRRVEYRYDIERKARGIGGSSEPSGVIEGDSELEGRGLLPSSDVPDIEPYRTPIEEAKPKRRRVLRRRRRRRGEVNENN